MRLFSMGRDNSSTEQNDQPYEPRRTPASVHFDDVSEKSPEQDWRHEGTNRRRSTLAQEEHTNTAAWRIDSLERLLAEIEKDPEGVLSMILDMRSIYTEYLDQANEADKERDEIRTRALGLEQELHISNEEREQTVSLLQQQTVKVKRYEKMIDALQSSASAKPDKPLPSVERPIDKRGSTFTHALSPLVNRQTPSESQRPTRNTHIGSDDGSFGSGKLTKALPDPPIFTDGKDLSIDQWLSKMRGKFEINWDHYPTDRSKLIYAKNRVRGKALQHLEPCLRVNSITPFATIEDLFNYLEDIFGNSHRKEHVMEKFRELKMGASSFSDFYSEFIRLASDLEYTSEMLIWEFKHKLTPRLQNRLNSGVEFPTSISALAKRCLSIYKQMQATDRIRDKTKPLSQLKLQLLPTPVPDLILCLLPTLVPTPLSLVLLVPFWEQ